MVSAQFIVLALAASAAPTVLGFASYLEKIPNGDALGKSVGHSGDGYTDFGKQFSAKGKTWAGVCKEKWGSSQVTVGAVLGDPCCKWTSGKAEFELSAPFSAGKECASEAKPSAAPAASSAAPAAAGPSVAPAAANTPAPAPGPATAAPAAGKPAAPTGPGQVLPAPIPMPAPGSGNAAGNGTAPAVPAPAPTPAASKPGAKPSGAAHKLCH